jgi:hypothetical protein
MRDRVGFAGVRSQGGGADLSPCAMPTGSAFVNRRYQKIASPRL